MEDFRTSFKLLKARGVNASSKDSRAFEALYYSIRLLDTNKIDKEQPVRDSPSKGFELPNRT